MPGKFVRNIFWMPPLARKYFLDFPCLFWYTEKKAPASGAGAATEVFHVEKVTIRDVAGRAGVSLSTVSRVMNRNQKVDPVLAERVLAAARELNYRSGPRAFSGRSGHIALILPTLENSYYSSIAAGAIDAAQSQGQHVLIMQTDSRRRQEDDCFRTLSTAAVDGVIFSGSDERNPLEEFPHLRGLPMVVAARRAVIPGIPHIYSDNLSAGYMATKYLLRLRRRKIALLLNFWTNDIHDYDTFLRRYHSPAQGACTAFDRYTGYCRALEEEGMGVDPDLIMFSGFSHESGYASAQELLARPLEFDGVLVSNDRCATGVLRLFREQGIQVPGQVSIICFNGGLMSSVVSPALTMVEQQNHELGRQSALQLNELIHGRPAHDVKIDVKLAIRGSTSLAPPADPASSGGK